MKDIDDTEIQVEADFADLLNAVTGLMFEIEQLKLRITNLEAQRTPQDNNQDDQEWY